MDLDLFDDLLPVPSARNPRAGRKFQPKAKPHPKNHTTQPTITIANADAATKDNPIPTTATTLHQDSSNSVVPVSVDPLPKLQTQEQVNNTAMLNPELPLPYAAHMEPLTDKDSTDIVHPELTVSDTHGELEAGFPKLGRETVDIFSDLDDFLCGSTTAKASTVRKFQPRVKNAPPGNKVPNLPVVAPAGEDSHAETPNFHASNAKDMERGPGLSFSSLDSSIISPYNFTPVYTHSDLASEGTVNIRETGGFDYDGNFLIDAERPGREEHAFPGLESLNIVSQITSTGEAQSVPSEFEYMDDDLHPASAGHDFAHFSTMNAPHSAVPDHSFELAASEDLTRHADISNAAAPHEVIESQDVPIISGKKSVRSKKTKLSTVLEESLEKVQETVDEKSSEAPDNGIESGKPSRPLRKRSTAPVLDDVMDGGTEENADIVGDDQYREETSHSKKAARKAKPSVQNEKAGRKRKSSSEGSNLLSKEPPKKKFSHSTRRTRRQVNKDLLNTPADPQKLTIRDLILRGEMLELEKKKGVEASKQSIPNQSAHTSFTEHAPYNYNDPYTSEDAPYDQDYPFVSEDASYDKDDHFASMHGLNADDNEDSRPKLNYHSYMENKTPKVRWSKQDTELFYEVIQQFGTDFAMIEQLNLFPGRSRRHMVLKYKKEERVNPMKVHDALTYRSKDYSHLELVIEKLQAEQNSDRDMESVGVSGDAEDNPPETNEVAKPEQSSEIPNDPEAAEYSEVYSPAKSSHEVEEDAYKCSPKSDYEEYGGY